jgi:antirestriction protein ArdC
MCAASSKMLNWQYDRLIGQLILLQDHAADPTCPCTLGESGEYCTAKHLLAIQEYATETMQMVDDPELKGWLNDLSIEAREHRDREKQFQCGQPVDFKDLAEWARSRRKYLEPLVYKGSCTIPAVKKDTTAVKLLHDIKQVPGEPESGVQKGMFGHDIEVHPRGKGHVIQVDIFEHGQLQGVKDAAGESCQLLKSTDRSIMPWFDRIDSGDMLFSTEPVADKGRKIDDLIKQLHEGIKAIWESDNYSAYLRTLSKFHNYSLGNCILIWRQSPGATHVAGFQTWKNLGRYVKKGEHAITILAPCMPAKPKPVEGEEPDDEIEVIKRPIYFKPVSVFDITQTDGAPIVDIEVPTLSGEVSDSYWHKLLNYAGQESVQVDFRPQPNIDRSTKGYYKPMTKEVWIKPDEPKAQQAKTLAHELAHHNSAHAPLFDRADEETIAESVAFVVCGHFGFDTGIRSGCARHRRQDDRRNGDFTADGRRRRPAGGA